MSPTMIIVGLASALCLLVARDVAKWAFTKDTAWENKRRAAMHLASTFRAYGLKKVPEFMDDFAVNDKSAMFEKMYDFGKLVLNGGEDAVVKEFEGVYSKVLDSKLATEEGRALLAAKLAEAAKTAEAVAAEPAGLAKVAA